MLGKEVVAKVMKMRGMSGPVLAKKLNYATTSGVSERIYGKHDMRADTLAKFLEALDCELIVKSTVGKKETWVINGQPETKEDDQA